VVNTHWAGDLAYRIKSSSQLRDSTGFSPVSPFSLSETEGTRQVLIQL